ncbi:thermonuclease family protein [Ohtaekwangia kribbensis]|uniref:Thermonuclease family protein n=1 Tax=Ohtaekwangia kribbensis TaxID=688913 RepID=A0ABW3K451_9BACT
MGVLRIEGRVKIAQFWPHGSADADTTQIEVDVTKDSFSFAADDKTFRKTKVYHDSYVIGRGGRKDVIKYSKRQDVHKISVRLQGVDAPELHYKAPPLPREESISDKERERYNGINDDFCQAFAENAAFALGTFLQRKTNGSKDEIKVIFYSKNIERPSDALDTYGRFVGNIMVGKVDINLWLAKEGWVVPTFYTSMTEEEINDVKAATVKGKSKKRVWGVNVTYDCSIEKKRLYRDPPCEYIAGSDLGKVLVPKLFRRTVNYHIEKGAKVFTGSISDYMIKKGQSDVFYDLDEFFEQGVTASTPYRISDFISKKTFGKKIDQIVFGEGPSTLKSNKSNKKIVEF